MAFCGYCGKQLEEGAKVCSNCGAPTEGRPITPEIKKMAKKTEFKEKAMAMDITTQNISIVLQILMIQ